MIATLPMSRGACAAATVLLGVLVVGPGHAEIVNRIVATVDGEPITAHEVERFARERADAGVSRDTALDAVITEKLLEKEADAQGIKVSDAEVDAYIRQVKERGRMDDDRFQKAMAERGLTLETYRVRVRTDIEKTQLVQKEIRSRVNVSHEEIKRYYDAHRDDYRQSERITVRDIFFSFPGPDPDSVALVKARADDIRALAVSGHPFEELAAQYSMGPGADQGGLLGTFKKGEMTRELDEVAFHLKPNEVSPVIATPRGLHILRVDEASEGTLRPLAEVEDEIRDELYRKALESRFEDWLTKDLRERHHVEVLD